MNEKNTDIRVVPVEKIIPLRHSVLREGKPVETAHFEGDNEQKTIHLAVVDEQENVLCCLTLMKRPYGDQQQVAYQLRGMATHPEARLSGYGKRLVDRAEEEVKIREVPLIWCNARIAAVPFYERCGWEIVSEGFMVEGIGLHHKMKKKIL